MKKSEIATLAKRTVKRTIEKGKKLRLADEYNMHRLSVRVWLDQFPKRSRDAAHEAYKDAIRTSSEFALLRFPKRHAALERLLKAVQAQD